MGKFCNPAKRIDRHMLFKALEIVGMKMPATFQKTFVGITIYHPRSTTPVVAGVTIIVRPTPNRARKSSEHRTFIVCERCRKEVPTGRYHQHYGKSTCDLPRANAQSDSRHG